MQPARERMSDLAWLIGKGDLSADYAVNAHFGEFLNQNWQLAGLFQERLEGVAIEAGPTSEDRGRLDDIVAGNKRLLKVLMSREALFTSRLTEAGLVWTRLKGSRARETLYDVPHHRLSSDIDVGVRPEAILSAISVALECGYVPAVWDANLGFRKTSLARTIETIGTHYEAGFLLKRVRLDELSDAERRGIGYRIDAGSPVWDREDDGSVICNVVVDIHHGIDHRTSLSHILPEGLDVSGEVQIEAKWFFLHCLMKGYWEAWYYPGTQLHTIADFVRLVDRLRTEDLVRCLQLCASHRLTSGAYYLLRRLDGLGVTVPQEVIEVFDGYDTIEPGFNPLGANDMGDIWPRLFRER